MPSLAAEPDVTELGMHTGTDTELLCQPAPWGPEVAPPVLPPVPILVPALAIRHLVPFHCLMWTVCLGSWSFCWIPCPLPSRLAWLVNLVFSRPVDLFLECLAVAAECPIPDSAKVTQKSCSVSRGGLINTSPATSMRLSPNHSNLKREPNSLGVGGGGISSLRSSPRKVQRWAVV